MLAAGVIGAVTAFVITAGMVADLGSLWPGLASVASAAAWLAVVVLALALAAFYVRSERRPRLQDAAEPQAGKPIPTRPVRRG